MFTKKIIAVQERKWFDEPYECEFTVRTVYKNQLVNDVSKTVDDEYSCTFVRHVKKCKIRCLRGLEDEKIYKYFADEEKKKNSDLIVPCVVRYDKYLDNAMNVSFKARLYHSDHLTMPDQPYSATVSCAREFEMIDIPDRSHFKEDGDESAISHIAKFDYDTRMITTVFFFRIEIFGESTILRMAFKKRKNKTFLDLECERHNVPFNICTVMYVCHEFYAWQLQTFKEFKDIITFSEVWSFFKENHLKSQNPEISMIVKALDKAETLIVKNVPSVDAPVIADDDIHQIDQIERIARQALFGS